MLVWNRPVKIPLGFQYFQVSVFYPSYVELCCGSYFHTIVLTTEDIKKMNGGILLEKATGC